jgi:hypothetical protein
VASPMPLEAPVMRATNGRLKVGSTLYGVG